MYKAPSAETISRQLRAAVRAEIPGADPTIWPNNLYVVSKAIALGLRGVYGALEWIHRQIFASTAEGEALERHGSDLGISRLAAQAAAGDVVVTAVNGRQIPNGTRMKRGDGAVFVSTKSVTAARGQAIVPVRAAEPGSAGNCDPDTPLKLEHSITGASAIVVGEEGIAGGMEVENEASLRARILDRKRNPPHGGSPGEYVSWAREIADVTRVFVQRATPAPGSVTVLFMTDNSSEDGIPTAAAVAALQAHLDGEAPSNARVVAAAPAALEVDVTIDDLRPNNLRTRVEVRAELDAMFRRRARPGTADANFVFSRSWIAEAVAMAAGEGRHVLVAPAADIACGAGQIAVVGTVTFT